MRTVIYHSSEWERMVSCGWITHQVETLAGVRVAFMVRPDWEGELP